MYFFRLDYTFQHGCHLSEVLSTHVRSCEEFGDEWEKDILHKAKRRCEDPDREDVVDAGQHGIDTSDTEDDAAYDPPQIRVQTYKQVVEVADELFQFSLIKNDQKMLDLVAKLESVAQKKSLEARQQQTIQFLFPVTVASFD